ncbi:hypothetical protein LEL_02747 [Akanthomyces lecanii RCEF 1005]|uniref:DUF8035 domain-containing protein n=1 Tax=Akanthomyces lecanii RCEF 1005 TaxID=1081108 RepID=A0A168IH54_CORDF|nr:hypothetical protein LEL_02747 [Akanthomyces lecanii RCEF 1005]
MSRGDRYEQDRYYYDRDRDYERDRDRGGGGGSASGGYARDRVVEDDRYYMRGGRGVDVEERDRFYERDVDVDRRRPAYEEPRYADHLARDFERGVSLDDREREYRRPRSDIFDRRPEPGPLVRHSPPPPARSRYEYDERDIYRESYREPPRELGPAPVRDPYRDEFYPPPPPRSERPEQFHEVVRERTIERDRSPAASRVSRSHRSHSRSRSRSASSHSRSGGTSVRAEYPKKGKTRIPARLVSTKIIIDLGYPYVEEGGTIIVQKALGQEHIDELLRLSEEYTKAEVDISVPAPAKSSAGEIIQERREEHHSPHHDDIKQEVIISPTPQPIYIQAPAPAPPPPAPSSHAPVIVDAHPRSPSHHGHGHGHGSVEIVDKTVIREDYPRYLKNDYEEDTLVVAPLVRARSRSRSRARSDIRAEIRALEREYEGRSRSRHHHHHHHRDEEEYDIVRTERMEDGQLVVFEERLDRVTSHPKPARIEKDKKGPPAGLLRAMLTSLT